MWAQYRKTAIPTQMIILTVCIFSVVTHRVNILGLIALFVIMEIFSVIGVLWGQRMRRKFEQPQRKSSGLKDLMK